ncbi:hypothetical protein [Saccharospirillum salsuginis]|uniref:Ig-like domain-containing protein n=1 Tax=Saccharospirillum salsuginis TaxID=418750 RepID=A0A918K3A8_9GAMM|nr:hypothetical protein [Saccharospirillum salsuginis]GGX46358.1 hypothetical protein GCM10007392_11790 [Saccharospirillum salsuginis]
MIFRNLISTVLLLLLAGLAQASNQFYFIARQAPEGSLTQAGQNDTRVYLRWDLVEGELPDDIASFSLYRDGTLLKSFPAQAVMSPAQIRTLYDGPEEQRRLLETVAQLKEAALQGDGQLNFDSDQFATRIHNTLTDPDDGDYWGQLASRQDFNIAIARYRGWHDDPPAGQYKYELIAHNATGDTRRVGLAQVDTTTPTPMLGPDDFAQTFLAQCDRPDFRDHFSVNLNWSLPGGTNQADRLASQLIISGYDLYRTRDNVETLVSRDLATEAAALPHDNRGQVQFGDLERVNDTLLTIAPDGDPAEPEWLETRADLVAAGLEPGDTRAYYLVPRDFAGQYGPTRATLVTVPDQARPPAPWDVRPFLNEAEQQVELTFDAIDLNSYRSAYGRDRRFCNLATADTDGYLAFVGEEEDCATDTPRRVQIDVSDYQVYRFDNYADASAFKDSDGDGFADAAEREDNKQCTPASDPAPVVIDVSEETVSLERGEQVKLIDTQPPKKKGFVYWYRLASVSDGGRLSLLSEPVRVNFPDRTLPDPPTVSVTHEQKTVCDCSVETGIDKVWSFEDTLSDTMDGKLTLQCTGFAPGDTYTLTEANIGNADGSLCQNDTFTSQCTDTATRDFTFTPADGSEPIACTLPSGSGVNMCGAGRVKVVPEYCVKPVPAPVGVVEGPLTITVTPPGPDQCVTLNQQIAGDNVPVKTSCGTGQASLDYEHSFGEFCGFAVTRDANNNVSATTQIGCRDVPGQSNITLAPARPVSITPIGDKMAVSWRMPSQRQSMVEVELTRTEPGGIDPITATLSAVELSGGGLQDTQIDIPALGATPEEWCVRLRTFAPSTQVGQPHYSDWSAALCDTRATEDNEPPQWLPWPGLADVPQGPDLSLLDGRDIQTASPQVVLSTGLAIPLGDFSYSDLNGCSRPVYLRGVYGDSDDTDTSKPTKGRYLTDLICRPSGLAQFKSALADDLAFMVFRQTRTPEGQVSDYIQVSPLIDYVHWVVEQNEKGTGYLGHRLRDPYIFAIADADQFAHVDIAYYDRAGLVPDHDYRYQLIYFDDDLRMREWRSTDWMTYQTNDTTDTGGGS